MKPRERVLRTFRFEATDRVPFDLMEGNVWPELQDHFRRRHGLETSEEVQDFLGTDFRWVGYNYQGPAEEPVQDEGAAANHEVYSLQVAVGPLAEAETIAEVEAWDWPDPALWQPGDVGAARRRWPDHALVFGAFWMPLFWGACEAFGMEPALTKMYTQPAVVEAFIRRRHAFYMDVLARGLSAAAALCDVCWLGDDYASQQAMIVSPELWRKFIKPYLAEQVALARRHGMHVLFHSCGAVREILPDLIDIGVSALLVFQTTAAGMDALSIARDFGGKLAFYGGIDIQRLLSFGTPEEVAATVRGNVAAFSKCGGYIVANSHCDVKTIRGENIEAMCAATQGE